jgi:hypothetical protein
LTKSRKFVAISSLTLHKNKNFSKNRSARVNSWCPHNSSIIIVGWGYKV